MSIAKQTGVPVANIAKRSGRAWAALGKSMGRQLPAGGGSESGTATTYLSVDFSDQSYTNTTTLPTGWAKTPNGTALYGSTSYTISSSRGWRFDYNSTPSGGTGPNGGLSGGVDATTGTQSSTNRYIFYESSSGGNGGQAVRTPSLDFSNALANDTLKLTFWFHMYGSNNQNQTFGVAATSSSTSPSSANETITGSGFTAESSGGLDILRWTNDTGTTTSTSNRIAGSQNTGNTGLWRKAEVDLNGLAGQSSVYLHFMLVGVTYFRSDFALDGIKIVGEE